MYGLDRVIFLAGSATTALRFGLAQVAPDPAGMSIWVAVFRELGSFGLIAFVVWWYATRVAPKQEKAFLEAQAQQRADYLNAAKEARADYIAERAKDRELSLAYMKAIDSMIDQWRENGRPSRAG